jgi:hypothetical protein
MSLGDPDAQRVYKPATDKAKSQAATKLSNLTQAKLEALVQGVAGGYKIARGQHTTVDEDDTVVTGLALVVSVVAQLDSDPVDGCMHVTSSIGDQTTTPVAGSILIKTWKSTDGDATLVPATTFSKLVNWIAVGT